MNIENGFNLNFNQLSDEVDFNPYVGEIPSNDFVVSRNPDGSPLSYYGDDIWDRSTYNLNGKKCKFSIPYSKNVEKTSQIQSLENEIRWFMFLIIFLRSGPVFGNGTLRHYLNVFQTIARYCEVRNLTFKNVFSSKEIFLDCFKKDMTGIHYGSSLAIFLEELGEKVLGFTPVPPSARKELIEAERIIRAKINQHSPLPTRIYSHILSQISIELKDIGEHVDRVVELYEACTRDPFFGRQKSKQSTLRAKLGLYGQANKPDFPTALNIFNLEDHWISGGRNPSFAGLKNYINEAMFIACLQIQAFTGMRLGEVELLPYDCISAINNKNDNGRHCVIKGFTTKNSNGKLLAAKWVTCDAAIDAIKLIQKISRAIYISKGFDSRDFNNSRSKLRLFVSTFKKINDDYLQPPTFSLSIYEKLKSRLLPTIIEDDVIELEHIDPHRAWRSEVEFDIGNKWNLTTHQLRRSLALYAQRSGLVTLPSLKRQLKHITVAMTTYYARNSSFAKNILEKDKDHFAKEWQEAQPQSQFLSYVVNVLTTDETLFGVHYDLLKRNISQENVIIFDRNKTLEKFKKGEIAYNDTLLGGCIKVGQCNKNPIDILHVNCLTSHCQNLVGSKEKLTRVIAAETNLVSKLKSINPDSPTYRHEQANLNALNETLKTLSVNTK